MAVLITKKFRFESAHYLPMMPQGHKCRRMHGHSFRMEVNLLGEIHPETGILIDFGDIKQEVKPLVELLDHYCINEQGEKLQEALLQNPTSENLARWFFEKLQPIFPNLYSIIVHETCTSRCEYRPNWYMPKRITIAIDGHAGCGKSTTAQLIAQKLGYTYIDSGAMYRAVSLYFLKNGISFEAESEEMREALQQISLDFRRVDGYEKPVIHLNGELIEEEIRTKEVSEVVSLVSKHASVRDAMVAQQRKMGKNGGVVMDGRDIGTVVFPNASLKIFMTADLEVRAARRKKEMDEKGIKMSLEEIIENLKERDRIDSSRKIAPLRKAHDAIIVDTSKLSIEDQVSQICNLSRNAMYKP